jgi:hypothetical protein
LVSFDPTNSFGYTFKLLINASKILGIEPSYSNTLLNYLFINNKSRYFFDNMLYFNNNSSFNFILQIIKTLCTILYIFNLNTLKSGSVSLFYIYYGNISIDILCLLSLFKQKYDFIRLKNTIVKQLTNNLESTFLVNNIKLNKSNLCLLINVNIQLEATGLNLLLKQRRLKGNFRLISICSFINIITGVKIIGAHLKVITLISKGLHPLCQTLKYEYNPCLLLNSQLLEVNSSKFINTLLLYLGKYFKYYKLNTVNVSIYEPSIYSINYLPNNSKMFFNFSSIYLLNLLDIHYYSIYTVLQLNLLYLKIRSSFPKIKRLCLTQYNALFNKKESFSNFIKYTYYFNLITKTFYQDSASFLNTQGLLKKSVKLFNNYNAVSSWKMLRIIFNYLAIKFNSTLNTNKFINYNLHLKFVFLKFVYLLILARKPINNVDIVNNLNPFLNNSFPLACYLKIKLLNFKLKFWINDLYIGGRDGFTTSSVTLLKYSKVIRLQYTNFF